MADPVVVLVLQTAYTGYFQKMPWLAIPFGDPRIESIAKHFDIRGLLCCFFTCD